MEGRREWIRKHSKTSNNTFVFLLLTVAVLSLTSYSIFSTGSNGLPQVSAETVLLQDSFDSENGGVGQSNYFGFEKWHVSDGTVDIKGPGFFDFYPGNGMYVDLDGSTRDAGKLTSKEVFTLSPGNYEPTFELGNNKDMGGTPASFNTMTVRLGTVYSEEFSREGPNVPLTTITREISVSESTTGQLSFDHHGGDSFGLILDDVKLSFITALMSLLP